MSPPSRGSSACPGFLVGNVLSRLTELDYRFVGLIMSVGINRAVGLESRCRRCTVHQSIAYHRLGNWLGYEEHDEIGN